MQKLSLLSPLLLLLLLALLPIASWAQPTEEELDALVETMETVVKPTASVPVQELAALRDAFKKAASVDATLEAPLKMQKKSANFLQVKATVIPRPIHRFKTAGEAQRQEQGRLVASLEVKLNKDELQKLFQAKDGAIPPPVVTYLGTVDWGAMTEETATLLMSLVPRRKALMASLAAEKKLIDEIPEAEVKFEAIQRDGNHLLNARLSAQRMRNSKPTGQVPILLALGMTKQDTLFKEIDRLERFRCANRAGGARDVNSAMFGDAVSFLTTTTQFINTNKAKLDEAAMRAAFSTALQDLFISSLDSYHLALFRMGGGHHVDSGTITKLSPEEAEKAWNDIIYAYMELCGEIPKFVEVLMK